MIEVHSGHLQKNEVQRSCSRSALTLPR